MINVKLIVLFISIDVVASTNKYCVICPNHTLCKYSMPGPSSSCKDYGGRPITKEDVNNIINKINERRNFVASGLSGLPQAANMNKIYWSKELAATAQRWVDQCDASTRPDKEDECRDLDDTNVGQAISSVEGPAPGLQLKSMIDVWFMQTLNYNGSVSYYNQSRDWKTNYFTQLIWGETDRIGCGKARFYVDHKRTMIERLVCNFAPKGNIHGKPVYAVGYPATQCKQNTPDRKFESLCRYFMEDNVKKFTTGTPAVSSLLRILNLSDKPETDPTRNNLKQVKFDVNETSEQRNQKTRHVLFNNSYALLKNMPPLPMQSHWNPPSNYSRNQKLQHYQQERGHSRVYHGHENHDSNFGSDYRDTNNRNYPNQNYATIRNYPSNYNYRKQNDYTTAQFDPVNTNDLRKYNSFHKCTRRNEPEKGDCEMSHHVGITACTGCTRDHEGNDCMSSHTTCRTDNPCMVPKGNDRNLCQCNTPSTTCATMPPRCQCNSNCKCFNVGCANTPCSPFRRSENIDNKDETKKSDLHYYDLSPNMAIRSGDDVNEQSPLKEIFSPSPKDEWIHRDTTMEDIFRRLSPKIANDHKQVKEIFENKRNNKYDDDYIYDSSYSRERKRRSPAGDITFKPFWQMDEFNRDKSTLLKSLRYTTISNKKMKQNRRTTSAIRTYQTTEPITVQIKNDPSIQQNFKNITEKYLSFDELMHLRKFTSTEAITDVRDESTFKRDPKLDARRDSKISTTAEYTTNTPFMRKKHCTRKLTCTWTAPTVIGDDGSVIVPGIGGDRGSRTPPGYVEGCTRTSTCTRDFLERNKFSTISDDAGSGDSTLEDGDYCEKRALDVQKRDSDVEDEAVPHAETIDTTLIINYMTYSYITEDIDYGTRTMITTPTTPSDNCVCDQENIRRKRNDQKPCSGNNNHHKHTQDNPSYGDLYYLVLQKIIQKWNSYRHGECFCNSAFLIRGTISLILFLFLCNILIKYIFI